MVADDDEDERVLIGGVMRVAEGARHVVTTVPDGRLALTALREKVFDVALLDLSMPGQPGLQWLERIVATRPDLARSTLVITGSHLDREVVERLARCGAGVLAKPFTLECLAEAVRSQIARPSRDYAD